MTLEVGTRLYIAPEVLGRRGGPRDQSKADMYSLGVSNIYCKPLCCNNTRLVLAYLRVLFIYFRVIN